MNMRFAGILAKIDAAPILTEPFPHVEIQDLSEPELFASPEIKLPAASSDRELVDILKSAGWKPIPFPGTTENVETYLKWHEHGGKGRWSRKLAWLMAPLGERLLAHILEAPKIHGDETPVTLLQGEDGSHTAYFWVYLRDSRSSGDMSPPAVAFRFTTGRGGKHPAAHLAGYRGVSVRARGVISGVD